MKNLIFAILLALLGAILLTFIVRAQIISKDLSALTIDQAIEQINIDVSKYEEANKQPSGKYVYISEMAVADGSYRVDEYETPCQDGFNPPVCYGYNIVFIKADGATLTQGTGKLNINTNWIQPTLYDQVASSTAI